METQCKSCGTVTHSWFELARHLRHEHRLTESVVSGMIKAKLRRMLDHGDTRRGVNGTITLQAVCPL